MSNPASTPSRSQEFRRCLVDFLHLAFLRGFFRVSPMITVPFMVRTAGPLAYGQIEFVQAISFYFIICIGYGFNYSATKHIAAHKDDLETIRNTVSAVYALKTLFAILSLLCVGGLMLLSERVYASRMYFLYYLPVIISSTFYPTFIFQGIGKMRGMTTINVTAKISFLLGMFALVRSPETAVWFLWILSGIDTLRLFAAVYLLYREFGNLFTWPSLDAMRVQLQEGFHIFLSYVSTTFYSRLPALFLGFYAPQGQTAIYALGVRPIRSLLGLLPPFTQAFFPLVSLKHHQGLGAGLQFVRRMLRYTVPPILVFCLVLAIGSEHVVRILSGRYIPEAAWILRLQAILPLVALISNVLSMNIFMPMKLGHVSTIIMACTSLLCLVLHTFLVPVWHVHGAGVAILITEVFSMLAMGIAAQWYIQKRRAR